MKYLLSACLLLTSTALVNAQSDTQARSPLDATVWGVVYDTAATRTVKVTPDVTYLKDDRSDLKIDIYTPADAAAGEKRPAVIFLNAIGDRPGDKVRHWEIYRTWPRLVAAHGVIGISMDADATRIQESLRGLFSFIARDGAKHGIDADRLGVYAASANVTQSAIYLMGTEAAKGIRAAALYYGGAPAGDLRKDLPVLFIVAEGDMAGLGQQAIPLWQRVTEARAPWTMVFASRMPHAFDAFEDNDESRRHIQQTLAFWKTHLEPTARPPWTPSPERAIVAATYGTDHEKTAGLVGKYLADHPRDARALVLLGRSLQQLKRYAEAGEAFEKAVALSPQDPFGRAGLGQVRLGQKRYSEAVEDLKYAVGAGFRNSLMYGQLGLAQLGLKQYPEAIESYERAFEMGIPPGRATRGVAYYNMACAYARLKNVDKAFEMLNKAVDEGLADRETLQTDVDLAELRTDGRFTTLLGRIAATVPVT